MTTTTRAFGATDKQAPLALLNIERRDPGPLDVEIDILFSGVCHSDLHTVKSEWPGTQYPCVPGHEIAGRVTRVGRDVKRFKPGDLATVGCLVDSCQTCASCGDGLEQYCDGTGLVGTYNSPDAHFPGKVTYGGYSTGIVVHERFCFRISEKLDLAAAAPLQCAGIAIVAQHLQAMRGPGKKVGIVGLGGLGHMGVKFSHAFGAHTVLFTTSTGKVADGKRLGADEVVLSTDQAAMKTHAGSFDLIINAVSVSHSLDAFTALLKRDGTLVLVGVPGTPHPSPNVGSLIFRRRQIAGSLIGGTKETQEMLDFCAERNIVCDIELIPMQKINEAYDRMVRSDVKYRFVIDMASLKG